MSFQPDEIKALRQALGLTQAPFASKFSVSRRLVAYWERGEKSPTKDFQKKLEQRRSEMPTDLERCSSRCHTFEAFRVNTPGEIKALREALGLTQAALSSRPVWRACDALTRRLPLRTSLKLKISERLVRYWETGIGTFFPCQFHANIL